MIHLGQSKYSYKKQINSKGPLPNPNPNPNYNPNMSLGYIPNPNPGNFLSFKDSFLSSCPP